MRSPLFTAIALLFTLSLIGCQLLTPGGGKPNVVINSPPSGSSFHSGDDVQVQSTATDSQAVTRVELQVDGAVVRTDTTPLPQGQPQFFLIQTWKATSVGTHNLIVRAYNNTGAFSDAGLTLTVTENVAASLSGTPTSTPTGAPIPVLPSDTPVGSLPTAAPPANTSVPAVCTPNSAYVADISIPDGTILAPGSTFVKTWRVLNNGTCPWTSAFSIAFVAGTSFAAGSAPIPATAPGATADISLPMTAPNTFGTFAGTWRLRAENGAVFGTNLTTVINIPNPNPPTPTNTPLPTSTNTPLPGAPNITSFTCSPCTIPVGSSSTLSWGAVTNATSVSIDQGIGGVGTPGSQSTPPLTTSTTYKMTASGPGGTTIATVTITVVGNFAGHWEHNFGHMDLTQNGASVTGTYHNDSDGGNGTVAGTVTGNVLTGTYQKVSTGSIQFTLGGGGNTFIGNWNTVNQWCGARTGIAFPSGCAFAGHWNTHYNSPPSATCAMDLTQVGTSVSGTYCNGTIQSGSIGYRSDGSGNFVVLSGTWRISLFSNGGFRYYLRVYTSQTFDGSYATSGAPATHYDWCGWRNGSAAPSPCLRTTP